MSEYLFAYGSLLTGTGNPSLDALVRRCCRFAERAWVPARLYDLGAYPGAVPARHPQERVYGRLARLAGHGCLRLLDEYEAFREHEPGASEFVRERVQVCALPGNRPIQAWIYWYNGSIAFRRRIPFGDWARRRRVMR